MCIRDRVNNERALALGLDTRRMYLLMAEPGEMIDFMQQHWRDRLLDLTYTVAPDLVIVDSLSTITSAGTNSPEEAVSYTHLRAHETVLDLVCRLMLEKKKTPTTAHTIPTRTCTHK